MMSVTLKRIDVVVLFVADVNRSKAFYRDTLGFELTFEDQESAYFGLEGASLLLLSVAGAQNLLTPEAVAARRSPGASSQLVAFVDDVDQTYRDLAAQGVEFVREPIEREWGMRTAHFKDPDGNVWEIAQPVPSHADGP
jgi:catechol 2,3-dioxygenase-like lactoylglutathione lyase family enzyme